MHVVMVEQSPARSWLARMGIFGCVLMAAIIVSSAYLRLTTMGIGCEPASAATLAGLKKLRSAGAIAPTDTVVCVLTGNLLKDTDAVMKNVDSAQMIEIEATIDAVAAALATG